MIAMDDPVLYLYRNYGARAAWLKGGIMRSVMQKGQECVYGATLIAVFPYFCGHEPGNISLYARGLDYHGVLKNALDKVAAMLGSGVRTRVCVDASPIDERKAACLAGLGVIGENGMLITGEYGSYVFIGEILVYGCPDEYENVSARSETVACEGCGACREACPSGYLRGSGVCLSAVTQKKGALTPEEERLITENGYVWGCDVCQLVCPMNKNAKHTKIPEFCGGGGHEIVKSLGFCDLADEKIAEKYKNRAFLWRGREVLLRNALILKQRFERRENAEGTDK